MTYVKGPQPVQYALGATFTDVASAVRDVGQDPCLIPIVRGASHLYDIIGSSGSGVPSAPSGPSAPGIGLCSLVRPLQIATYIAERPWVVPAGVLLVVGSLVGIGIIIGRDH